MKSTKKTEDIFVNCKRVSIEELSEQDQEEILQTACQKSGDIVELLDEGGLTIWDYFDITCNHVFEAD